MCTAISMTVKDHYFGRNLDLEYSYKEAVTVTPRNYPFLFRKAIPLQNHFAMIGIATVSQNYPLYYDATNEYGLSMAALNFPGNAFYYSEKTKTDNIAPFEIIPWILCQCKHVQDAIPFLKKLNPVKIPFSAKFPLSPLHWILSDSNESLVIESLKDGLYIHHNPVGVLTNNPPFDYHLYNLTNYINLTSDEPSNRFSKKIELAAYSRGMGGIGLPGDLSSASRFVRASFTKLNSKCDSNEEDAVTQFFHILDSVAQTQGCVKVGSAYEKTVYTSCCNTEKGVYYYKTYSNSQINAVNLFHEDLDRKELIQYPLRCKQQIRYEN